MASNAKSQSTLVHDTICLFLITLIAGILLGAVNMITVDPIKEQEEKTKQEAYAAVYDGAEFVSDDAVNSSLEAFQADLTAGKVKTASGTVLSDVEIQEVMKATVELRLPLALMGKVRLKAYRLWTAQMKHQALDRIVPMRAGTASMLA